MSLLLNHTETSVPKGWELKKCNLKFTQVSLCVCVPVYLYLYFLRWFVLFCFSVTTCYGDETRVVEISLMHVSVHTGKQV